MKLSNGTIGKAIAAIVLLALSTTVFAQESAMQKKFRDRAVKNLVYGLGNDLPSVVESSIFVSLELKDKYPNENYGKLLDKFTDLANNGATLQIRYKAQLASLYYNYHDLFRNMPAVSKEDPDQTFRSIAQKIETNTLAVK